MSHSKSPPSPGSVRPFAVPAIASSRLSNGLGVHTVAINDLPLVSIALVMDVGEARLGTDRAGHAVLTGRSLQGGTAAYDGAALAEAIEGIGASISVMPGWDSTRVHCTVLADHLEDGLDLLAEMVLRPTFPTTEVERVRNQRLAAIEQARSDPGRLADLSLSAQIYSDDSPYARPAGGSATNAANFNSESAQAFFEEAYGPSLSFVAGGDIERSEFVDALEQRFGNWTGGWSRGAAPTAKPRTSERRVIIVPRPGAVQSEIRLGHVGVARTIDDYFPLRIWNGVLGGTFTSRLNLNLREEHGFTYGVRSRFQFRRGAGPFSISAAVSTEVTAAAVREAVHELDKLVTSGPTEDEVASVRDFLSGVFPLQMETTAQVTGQVVQLVAQDLPMDYLDGYRDRIRSVTAEQATQAGQAHVRPDTLQIVVVGDPDAIRPELEELGLGAVEVVEAE